ncbi:Glutathione synthase [Pedobacter cryoconitis]|uniref:Glutathione synthase n=1 Tax=Pedobacter cryoconitis TaxID=188932 RepID=A0A127VJ19_9SPHI|nr:glutathione synthase [Pedobacter cryoconitis]AMQ01315.1 Glutathione synthase [Pedobacter cryoconitis]
MKKIGILFGQERSFPEAFVKRVNELGGKDFQAEFVNIDKIFQAEPLDYAVIIDRISQDVPFYRASLKNAAITGTAVINNPFWWSADEKFFNNALAVKLGIPVPKTALIPSHARPDDTNENSFSNLAFPFDWDNIFEYTGFPAYMKPFDGGGWKEVYKLNNKEEFFDKHSQTHQHVMMLQEEIEFDEYFRCYCIGGKYVRIMQYEPRNPAHLRYAVEEKSANEKLLKTIHDYVIKLNQYLGYDFNTVEFAVRDGIPYAIDFCNPAPDADIKSVGQENFDWVVEYSAKYAIERAETQIDGQDNLTWGEYLKSAIAGKPLTGVGKPAKAIPAEAVSPAKPKAESSVKTKPQASAKTKPESSAKIKPETSVKTKPETSAKPKAAVKITEPAKKAKTTATDKTAAAKKK